LFATDLAELERALTKRDFAAVDRILSRRGDSLCAGLEDCDPVFDNWLRMTTTHWSDSLIERLSKSLDAPGSTLDERKASAAKWGNWLFLPAIVIPLVSS
jgi:hypothetical protein